MGILTSFLVVVGAATVARWAVEFGCGFFKAWRDDVTGRTVERERRRVLRARAMMYRP